VLAPAAMMSAAQAAVMEPALPTETAVQDRGSLEMMPVRSEVHQVEVHR